jgi:hypothetical protein
LRDHVKLIVNPDEARAVVRIYELYDSGLRLKRIAAKLVTEGFPPAPALRVQMFVRPRVRRSARPRLQCATLALTWAPGTVSEILLNPRYSGTYRYNRYKKRDDYGSVDRNERPEAEHIQVAVPQIVPSDLWARVQARRADLEGRALRLTTGRLAGRPTKSER